MDLSKYREPILTITPFGVVFLPIIVAVLALRRTWLLPLLIVSAVFHAPAPVLISPEGAISPLGVSPWLCVSLAIGVDLFRRILRTGSVCFGSDLVTRCLFGGWTVFAAVGVISAFVMPQFFEGMLTYNPENLHSLKAMEPLEWRMVNAAQAVNLAVCWVLMVYVLQQPPDEDDIRRLFVGFIVAGVLALAFSLLQRLMVGLGIPYPGFVVDSLNPSYHQSFSIAPGGIFRANWPFSEPSYASAWFAGLFGAGLGLLLFTRFPLRGAAVSVAALTGVVNSFGGSGIAGSLAIGIVLCAIAAGVGLWSGSSIRRTVAMRLLMLLALGGALLVGGLAIHYSERLSNYSAQNFYARIVAPRLHDRKPEGPSRTESNRQALRILVETEGVGVGLGSNRASSYIANMLSNLGILPTLLFLGLITFQSWRMHRIDSGAALAVFLSCGLGGTFLSMVAAVPDLLWPAWWVWPISSFWMLYQSKRNDQKPGELSLRILP